MQHNQQMHLTPHTVAELEKNPQKHTADCYVCELRDIFIFPFFQKIKKDVLWSFEAIQGR